MEHAWHLLKNENWRVVEVAREVGYKNPNHFSTAFKRKYGISPSQLA
ncbi:MAG: AraC family transcriptional regulator [Bacteroidota bacterium]